MEKKLAVMVGTGSDTIEKTNHFGVAKSIMTREMKVELVRDIGL
jgi:hypothetical protein